MQGAESGFFSVGVPIGGTVVVYLEEQLQLILHHHQSSLEPALEVA